MFKEAINNYLHTHGYESIDLKAVLFDMDGVLFDSMSNHAESWHKIMKRFGFGLSREEAYMHEGRTGASTINIVSRRERGHDATEEEIKAIYQAKTEEFNKCPKAERMPGALEVLTKIKSEGLTPMVVTGSGQTSLLDRLNHNFPGIFQANLMVTAFDVKYGKPNPEPYLMALKKGGFKPNEALVIENAPLGVQAGVAARKIAGIVKVQVAVGAFDGGHLIQGKLAAAQGHIVVGVVQTDVERAQTPQYNVGTGGKRRQGAAYHKAHSQQHSRQTMTQINAFHVLHLSFSWVCVWKSAYRSARSAAWAAP